MNWIEQFKEVLSDIFPQLIKGAMRIPGAFFVLLAGWLLLKLINYIIKRVTVVAKFDPTLQSMFKSIITAIGWVMILATVLHALGFQNIAVAVGGSVALVGMALATGLNSIPQDLLAGIFLISDPDFRVGYLVKVAGVEGIVEELTIRKCKVRDKEGQLHIIPNRSVDAANYVVISKEPHSITEEEKAV
jgi:small-conductance mechanosensitive channel